jgi:DNA-binding response OmpR family regulator
METLLAERRETPRVQEKILALLQGPAPHALPPLPEAAPPRSATTARRERRVLLIDDDAASVAAAAAALEAVRFRVQVARDGNTALAAIAREKPDAIVMELEIGGAMAGKDMINMVRATMEWIDIPVALYTRTSIASVEEARAVHGGDAFVPKSAGPDALVACVGSMLRPE